MKKMFCVKCKLCAFGYLQNLAWMKKQRSQMCSQTYFYIHGKTRMQIFNFLSAAEK